MIVPLKPHHSAAVAQLHLNYLRSPFAGRPGLRLLQANYQAIAAGTGACGFVAEADNGQPVGYICGVWDWALVRKTLIRNYWLPLALWGALQIIYKPGLFISLLQRVGQPTGTNQPKLDGYELRPIVVAPAAQGTGVAAELVNTLLMDAGRRGFQSIYLFTEPDNAAANTFYQKTGFQMTGTIAREGIMYNRYECSVCEAV